MKYGSIINLTYYNLYGGIRRKYYIYFTLHFLYFHLTIVCLHVLCTNIIIKVCIKNGIDSKIANIYPKMAAILYVTMETWGVAKKSNTCFTRLDLLITMGI